MPAVAFIPARGGSKRLPRKNIIDFLGRPIIAWTIEAARKSGCFDRIVVSTEDVEIGDVAARFGAELDRRSPELASDEARVVDVCRDFLERDRQAGRAWTELCVLYATAPLREAADVRATMGLLEPGACGFALAVTAYDLPPHQALRVGDRASMEPMWPELVSRRASEIPVLRVDNGSTYAVSVPRFLEARTFYGPGLRGHDMPRERSIDIDTRRDYELALWEARRLANERSQ